jgi:hypothetical protein
MLTGALLGLGSISLFTVGWTLLPLALGLAVYGILQFGPRRTWALVLGVGALPALVLAFDIATHPEPCPVSGPVVIPLVVTCWGTALPLHLVFLVVSIALLVTLPVYGPTVLAMLSMIEPPLFLAFPLIIFAVSLLHGWRGWLGMLIGIIALQVLLRLFISEIWLLVSPQCSPGPCISTGESPLLGAGYPGPIFFFGALASLPAVLLNVIVRQWPFSSRSALA